MANKYVSNSYTYMARNLVWNNYHTELPEMDAPNPLQLGMSYSRLVYQPFRLNWGGLHPGGRNFLITSNFTVKRVGLYSNFADGLVFRAGAIPRIILLIRAFSGSIEQKTGTATLTAQSTAITGTNLLTTFPNFSLGTEFFCTSLDAASCNVYGLQDVSSEVTANLSDFSFTNEALTSLYKFVYTGSAYQYSVEIPVLNTMFDMETLFRTTVTGTASISKNVLLSAQIILHSYPSPAIFDTITVDPDFNELPVSFDAMMEIEQTESSTTGV